MSNEQIWGAGEREAVARAIFGDGWECCANLGPYVQATVNELNEAREALRIRAQCAPDLRLQKYRDLLEACADALAGSEYASDQRLSEEVSLALTSPESEVRGQAHRDAISPSGGLTSVEAQSVKKGEGK